MKKLGVAIFILVFTSGLFAADIGERLGHIIPVSFVKELVEKGELSNSAYRQKGVSALYLPNTQLAKEANLFWTGEEAPFFIETLYLYKKPAAKQGEAGKETQSISGILRSLSHLQGIEYYSTSRKKMRTLYEKSYVVESIQKKERIADPISGSADGVTLTVVQKDLTFGEYTYEYKYRQNDDSVAFFSRNIEPMNYSIIKMIDKDNLHVALVVQDLGDYLLIYGVTRVSFLALPGLEDKINASFSTRAEAIYKWFINEYEKQ